MVFNLAFNGEETLSGGVHEDQLVVISTVGIDPKDDIAVTVVGGETIAGVEERCFADGKWFVFIV